MKPSRTRPLPAFWYVYTEEYLLSIFSLATIAVERVERAFPVSFPAEGNPIIGLLYKSEKMFYEVCSTRLRRGEENVKFKIRRGRAV